MSGQEPDVPHIQEAVARAIRRLRRTLVVAALVLALGVCAASLWWSPPQWGAGVVGAAGIALLMVVTRWVLDHMLADPSNPVPWVAISYVGKALVIAASVVPVKLWGGEVALPRAVCAKAAKLSYAVFLTHHVIIQRLVRGFDLAALSRRDTAILFCVYLLATYAESEALLWLQRRLREERQKLFQ